MKTALEDMKLYKMQSTWFYKVLEDKCIERSARALILDAKDQRKDIQAVWTKLCTKFSDAIKTDLKVQKLTAYLCGIRLDNSTWRGTQTNMILHYKEQARLYKLIPPKNKHFTDEQLCRFLNLTLIGIENLQSVKSLYKDQQRAAGKGAVLTFSQYVELLFYKAAIYDAGKGRKSPINS